MTSPIAHPVSLSDDRERLAQLIETEIISGMENCLSASEIATCVAGILVHSRDLGSAENRTARCRS